MIQVARRFAAGSTCVTKPVTAIVSPSARGVEVVWRPISAPCSAVHHQAAPHLRCEPLLRRVVIGLLAGGVGAVPRDGLVVEVRRIPAHFSRQFGSQSLVRLSSPLDRGSAGPTRSGPPQPLWGRIASARGRDRVLDPHFECVMGQTTLAGLEVLAHPSTGVVVHSPSRKVHASASTVAHSTASFAELAGSLLGSDPSWERSSRLNDDTLPRGQRDRPFDSNQA